MISVHKSEVRQVQSRSSARRSHVSKRLSRNEVQLSNQLLNQSQAPSYAQIDAEEIKSMISHEMSHVKTKIDENEKRIE